MEQEPKMNEKKKSISFLVVCLISIIIVMGGVILYLLLNNVVGKEQSQNKNEKDAQGVVAVNLSEKEANKLIDYVPEATPFGGLNGGNGDNLVSMVYSTFLNKKLEVSNMNLNWIVYKAIKGSTKSDADCSDYYPPGAGFLCSSYEIEDVQNYLKSHYEREIKNLPETVYGDFLFTCEKKNDNYICNFGGGNYPSDPDTTKELNYVGLVDGTGGSVLLKKYEKAEKDKDNLYVYLKVTRAIFTPVYIYNSSKNTTLTSYVFRLYKHGMDIDPITGSLHISDYYESNATKSFTDKIYNQFKDKMTAYKITYKIDGSNYLLSSVEPVE